MQQSQRVSGEIFCRDGHHFNEVIGYTRDFQGVRCRVRAALQDIHSRMSYGMGSFFASTTSRYEGMALGIMHFVCIALLVCSAFGWHSTI